MKYLFFASVGPVQSFIAAARKVRDLYAGSWILSEVAKAAALEMVGDGLIFPFANKEELGDPEFAASNKLLAVVETEDPADFAKLLKRTALGRLRQLAKDHMDAPKSLGYDRVRMLAHLENLLEFYAAWVPYSGPAHYSRERELVEDMLNARKALHNFQPHIGKPGLKKSSLDGGRETVITARGDSARDLMRLREQEELDGPGLLKRFVNLPSPKFESTTEAAALPYMRKVERLAMTDAEIALSLGALRRLNEDAGVPWESGEVLFEHESREVYKHDSKKASLAERLRRDLYATAAKRPEAPYYALMQADGDNMGKTLRGLDRKQHETLSRQLSDFSRTIHKQLKEMECMPIFAGGDELLVVMPLHKLRGAAEMVHSEFRGVRVGNEALKLSAGIAIAHALEPLDEVRELARQAFKHAKEQPRKDAVSIVVCPHSGAPVEATGAWKAMDQSLADITSAFKKDELSFGFAHELQELLDRTAGGDLDGVLPQMAKAIAGKKKENSRALGLIDSVNDGKEYSDGKEYRKELQKLTNRILVARKIAKAERDAEGDEAVS